MSDDQSRAAVHTIEDFMVQAVAMELEASQRYAELADVMEVHNNRDVAELFRKMSVIEGKHAEQVMAQMGWSELPAGPRAAPWEGCCRRRSGVGRRWASACRWTIGSARSCAT